MPKSDPDSPETFKLLEDSWDVLKKTFEAVPTDEAIISLVSRVKEDEEELWECEELPFIRRASD